MNATAHGLAAPLTPSADATAAHTDEPAMNHAERLTYFVYVSMATLIAAFLAVTLAVGLSG